MGSIFTQHLKNAGKVLAPALKIFARRNNDQDPYLAIEQNALSQMQNNQLAKDAEIDEWASLADAHDQIRCQVNSLGKEANELQQILTPKKAGRSKKDEGLNEQPANAAELQAQLNVIVEHRKEKETKFQKIKAFFRKNLQNFISLVDRLKASNLWERAVELRKGLAKAWEIAKEILEEGKELVSDASISMKGISETPEVLTPQ